MFYFFYWLVVEYDREGVTGSTCFFICIISYFVLATFISSSVPGWSKPPHAWHCLSEDQQGPYHLALLTFKHCSLSERWMHPVKYNLCKTGEWSTVSKAFDKLTKKKVAQCYCLQLTECHLKNREVAEMVLWSVLKPDWWGVNTEYLIKNDLSWLFTSDSRVIDRQDSFEISHFLCKSNTWADYYALGIVPVKLS